MRAAPFLLLLAASALPVQARTTKVIAPVVPHARPALKSDTHAKPATSEPAQSEPAMDMSHAVPAASLSGLPSSARQFGDLKAQLDKDRPRLAGAKEKSETLARQAADLRARLIATAARIETLERQTISLDAQIVTLRSQDAALTAGFVRDRISVTRLLAILERLQHDMPPALVVRPDDALAAARGAMLVGASLPPVYAQAVSLAARIDKLKTVRGQLVTRRLQAAATAASLTGARADLQILTDAKEREAQGAASEYGDLKTQLDAIAAKAASFQVLLARIARLRRAGPPDDPSDIVTVTAQNGGGFGPLTKGSLLHPVVGTEVPGTDADGPESAKNPGLTFATAPGAQVIAPADGKVLFAGSYHKSGQVLILEISTGYDLVLAGLGRVTVRPNDELLAGEPVGTMALAGSQRLYFELRRKGRALDPAPWLSQELRKAKKT